MRSNSADISAALYVGVPLNIMCSMKWDIPASSGSSSREPTETQIPREMERTSAIVIVTTPIPQGSTVLS